MPAPAAGGQGVGARAAGQRAGAAPATGGLAAAGARHGGQVAAARDLHEHRGAGAERGPRGLEGHRGHARRAGGGVAEQLAVVLADRGHAGPALADRRPVGDDVVRPAAGDEQGRLGGAGEPGDQQRRAVAVRAGHGDVAGVRVGRAGLGEGVVAVVPHRDEPGLGHRGEGGGAGADDDAHVPAGDREPAAVALGGAEVGGEGDDGVRARDRLAGGLDAVEVAAVGHHEHRAAPGRGRRGGGLGEAGGPVLARQGLPDGVRAPGRARASSRAGPRG